MKRLLRPIQPEAIALALAANALLPGATPEAKHQEVVQSSRIEELISVPGTGQLTVQPMQMPQQK
jgi:hypothetical protein